MSGSGDHDGMDTPFQQAEDDYFPGSAPASFSFVMSPGIALIDFNFTRGRCLMSNLFYDDFSQFLVIQSRCITIDAYNFSDAPEGVFEC